jgi:hypothetical protein
MICRVFFFGHSAKKLFAECQIKNTRQNKTLGKEGLCRVLFYALGKDKFQIKI